MIIGVDTTNIKSAGGCVYLEELVTNFSIEGAELVMWADEDKANYFKDKIDTTNVKIVVKKELSSNLIVRVYWQTMIFPNEVRSIGCDVVLNLNGIFLGKGLDFVTVCQNILPYDFREVLRSGFQMITLKLILMKWLQLRTFRQAKGVIFLSQYSKQKVFQFMKEVNYSVIPHSAHNFGTIDKKQRCISYYSKQNPYKIFCILSFVSHHHQCQVLAAVAHLKRFMPVSLTFISNSSNKRKLKQFKRALSIHDPEGLWVEHLEGFNYESIREVYSQVDLLVFPSTIESFGIPIVEAMNSKIPIVCSMAPSLMANFGNKLFYCNIFSKENTVDVIKNIIESPHLRQVQVDRNYKYSKSNSWKSVATETFDFITSTLEVN